MDSAHAADTQSSDTLRGTVAIVGSEPATMVSLRPAGGGAAVLLSGDALTELRRAAGADVWVAGQRTDERTMQVARFEVRGMHGIPAVDGVLTQEGRSYVLLTHDGKRIPMPRLPAELRSRVGARVWIAGQPDRDPELFGVITPDDQR
jgi:hypothetical protein